MVKIRGYCVSSARHGRCCDGNVGNGDYYDRWRWRWEVALTVEIGGEDGCGGVTLNEKDEK